MFRQSSDTITINGIEYIKRGKNECIITQLKEVEHSSLRAAMDSLSYRALIKIAQCVHGAMYEMIKTHC